jgi:hypothetical protein
MADLALSPVAVATRPRPFITAAVAMTSIVIVMAPSLWNGFPLLFPDTGGYLERAFANNLALGRSAMYGVFLAAGIPTFFWFNVLLQSALVVWQIALTLRVLGFGQRPGLLLLVVATLSLASGMAWYAAMLMPDIWLPSAILALYLLTFRTAHLRGVEKFTLVAVIAFAIASHMGTLGVCFALVAGFGVLHVLPRRPFRNFPRPRIALSAGAVGAGMALALFSNLIVAGEFKFTPGGDSFMFGRLVQDGIIARYLEDRCPDPTIRLCAYRTKMPASADDWLWAPGNILNELGGWDAFADEQRRIVIDTVKMYPLMHVVEATKTTLEQIGKMKTEVSLVPDWMAPAIGTLKNLVPQMTGSMMAARQQTAPYPDLIAALNYLHVPVAAFSMTILGLLLIAPGFRRVLPPEILALAAVVLISVFVNALICGTFSNPVDRYESRLIWLAPLALMIAALAYWNRKTKGLTALFPPHPTGTCG